MLRRLFRFLGYLALLGGLLVGLLDLLRWGGGPGLPSFRPLGQLWYDLHPGSLNLIQAVLERYLLPVLWNPVLLTVLTWGAAPVLVVLGLILLWLTRRRR